MDVLLGLLEKIYKALHHHSPVLQKYSEVRKWLHILVGSGKAQLSFLIGRCTGRGQF